MLFLVKITLAQINPTVGDFDGNMRRIEAGVERAAWDGSDVVVFPELCLTGYPPLDFLHNPSFIRSAQQAVAKIRSFSERHPELGIIVGTPWPVRSKLGNRLVNAALFFAGGNRPVVQAKTLLPTYDVFDEGRYFDPATTQTVIYFKSEKLGLSVCEDGWAVAVKKYKRNPIESLEKKGVTVLINISASPFQIGKIRSRQEIFRQHALEYGLPVVLVNQVGGNDELIFDGSSCVFDAEGRPVGACASFREEFLTVDLKKAKPVTLPHDDKIATVYEALVLGVRDYMRKCDFAKALVGLSGGVDSAVVCALAVAAAGAENVLGIAMPSPFSSEGSVADARLLAQALGINFKIVPITPIFKQMNDSLAPVFEGRKHDATEENIQARIRGNLLMAISNKFGHLLLSTGNKSELSVGYCTLYGDMSGGICVLADLPKTMVYELADYINREKEIIPRSTITKPPSAELRPDQKDQDTLPPYDVLDAILYHRIEENLSDKEIVAKGFDAPTVKWVVEAIRRNEYKRRQAAPGFKITSKAFGIGRRIPIAAKLF